MDPKYKINLWPETVLAIKSVVKAGETIMKIYNKKSLYTLKDGEPVTLADKKSNEIIQDILSRSNYVVLSEESEDNKKRLNEKKVWVIDPLDGTVEFINKTGEFTIMVGLVENNKPILGVINKPTDKTLFIAQKGCGAYKVVNNKWKNLKTTKISDIQNCRAVCSRSHLSNDESKFIKKLNLLEITKKGSSLKVMDICSGKAELYFTTTSKIKQWDTCASNCLISESGGRMTDLLGNEIVYNTNDVNHKNGILATNGKVHKKVIDEYVRFLKN